jgi:hypothetical protein
MNSIRHALISLLVAGLALAVTTPPVSAAAVVAISVGVGVGIDFDHFLLARWGGDWSAVRRCLRDPRILLFDQGAIFADGEVGAVRRLLSHVVIGGVAVPLVWLTSPYVAGLVAASLYGHVLADLIATTRDRVAVEADDPRLS